MSVALMLQSGKNYRVARRTTSREVYGHDEAYGSTPGMRHHDEATVTRLAQGVLVVLNTTGPFPSHAVLYTGIPYADINDELAAFLKALNADYS
jgi:hypothetical protein